MTCTLSVIRSFKFGALGSVAKVKRNGLSRSRLLLISEAGAGGSVFSDLQPVSKTTLNESTTAAEIAGCLRCMARVSVRFVRRLRRRCCVFAALMRDGQDTAVGQIADSALKLDRGVLDVVAAGEHAAQLVQDGVAGRWRNVGDGDVRGE